MLIDQKQKPQTMSILSNQVGIINPFSILGVQHQKGLDHVVRQLTGSSSSSSSFADEPDIDVTVDQIVNATIDYINSIYGHGRMFRSDSTHDHPSLPPSAHSGLGAISDLELSIIIQDAMNNYLNAKNSGGMHYTGQQEFFIFQLLEGIHTIPTFGIAKYIERIESNIVESGMGSSHQNQLLMVTSIGKANFNYWLQLFEGEDPDAEAWGRLIEDFAFGQPSEVTFLVAAAMEATLFGQKHAGNASLLATGTANGGSSVAALASSIALVTGVITQGWIQYPAKPRCVKPVNQHPTVPSTPTERVWGYSCDNGASGTVSEWSLDDAQQTVGVIGSLMGTTCALIPYATQ